MVIYSPKKRNVIHRLVRGTMANIAQMINVLQAMILTD
jgi:alpha-L-arabinofuranosidase